MRRTVNLKLLGITVVAVAVLATGVHLLHGRQVKRHAGALLHQAEAEEQRGRLDDAEVFLSQYIELVPDDLSAIERYAGILERIGTQRSSKRYLSAAYFFLERVHHGQPERQDLTRKLIDLAMSPGVGTFSGALRHIEELDKDGKDPEFMHLRGRCQEQLGHYDQAFAIYEKMLKKWPDRIDAYLAEADLFRTHMGRHPDADRVIARMVETNPENYKAYLASARYWQARGDLRKVAANLDQGLIYSAGTADVYVGGVRVHLPGWLVLLVKGMDKADILLASGELELSQARSDQLDKTEKKLTRSLELDADNPATYLALAKLKTRQGKTPEAVEYIQTALAKFKGDVQVELGWTLANLLLDNNNWKEAHGVALKLTRAGLIQQVDLKFLDARETMVQGQWDDARQKLEALRFSLGKMPERLRLADFLLGLCYEKLGDREQQYAAFHRVALADASLMLDQLSTRAYRGMGAALLGLNRIDDAIESYRQAVLRDPSARVELARLLVLKNLGLPPGQRNYGEAEQLLQATGKDTHSPRDVKLLQAQILAEKGETKEARTLLEKLRAEDPGRLDSWVALANLSVRDRKPADALTILDQAQKQLGDRVELRLVRASVLVQGGKQNITALGDLLRDTKQFKDSERAVLVRGLIDAYERLGAQKEADGLLSELVKIDGSDLDAWMALFHRAVVAGDTQGMDDAISKMRGIGGDKGVEWKYAEILKLLGLAEKGDKRGLDRVRLLLSSISTQQARIVACSARLEDLEGKEEIAIDRYRQAVELGERSPVVVRRLVALLSARNRYADVGRILEKLPDQLIATSEIRRLNAEVLLHRAESGSDPDLGGALARVAEVARKAVPEESTNYQDQLWLGYMLLAAGKPEAAKDALERAVRLRPDKAETWVGLVYYFNKTAPADKDQQINATLERARRALAKDQQALAFAQFYEQLDRIDEAEKQYLQAVHDKPEDIPTRRAIANFYLYKAQDKDKDKAQAQQHLQKIIALTKVDAEKQWAQRLLAFSLASAGNYQQAREACKVLGLLDANASTDWISSNDLAALEAQAQDKHWTVDDLRAAAAVMATQINRTEREKAIAFLQLIKAQRPADLFMLAKLYDTTGKPKQCRQTMLQLLTNEGDNPEYVAYFARVLLVEHDLAGAEGLVEQLEHRLNQSQAFVTVELKARVWAAQGRHADVPGLLTAFLDSPKADPPDRTQRLLLVAALYDSLGQAHRDEKSYPDRAEKFYREYVAKRTAEFSVLVGYLGRQGQIKKALDEAAAGWEKGMWEVTAEACLGALHGGTPSPEDLRRVDGWLAAAREKVPQSMRLLVSIADLRDLQGNYDTAIDLYKQVLDRQPLNVVALNNLAWLLALKKQQGNDALELINRAIDQWGPAADLRDTRAVVYLTLGESGKAVKELQQALADGKTGPRYFHLAEAYAQQHSPVEARAEMVNANNLGLKPEHLHALERNAYNELLASSPLSKK
jgi:tetratricopeptide (TPR) repeat protein